MDGRWRSRRDAAGYSLLEILVATLVLSVGLLGIAGMFIATLQDTRSGLNRSKASVFAWDMAERIRANRTAGAGYAATETDAGTPANCSARHDVSAPAECSPDDLAAHDIYEWKQRISDASRGLPEGTGSITLNSSTSPPTYTIQVNWMDGYANDGSVVTDSLTVVTQL